MPGEQRAGRVEDGLAGKDAETVKASHSLSADFARDQDQGSHELSTVCQKR